MNIQKMENPGISAGMALPDLIKAKRSQSGMTQQELADAAGISLSAVKQYETGRQEPTMPKMRAIATALEMSPNEIWAELDIGDPDEDRLRLSLSNDMFTFISAKATFEQLQILRKVLMDMDGSLADPSPVRVPAPTALEQLEAMVVGPMGLKSRKLHTLIEAAADELDSLDWDELDALVKEHRVTIDGIPSEDGQEQFLIDSILLAVLYQADPLPMVRKKLQHVLEWLNEEQGQKIPEAGFFDDTEEHLLRQRPLMAAALVQLAKNRKFLPKA